MAKLNTPVLNIKEYKDRVIAHFQAGTDISKATEEDWKLLGQLFLNASENGDDDLDAFDQRILTKEEYRNLYELNPDNDIPMNPIGFCSFQDSGGSEG